MKFPDLPRWFSARVAVAVGVCATAGAVVLGVGVPQPAVHAAPSKSCQEQVEAIKASLPEDLRDAVTEVEDAADGRGVARAVGKLLTGVADLAEGAELEIGMSLYARKSVFSPEIQTSMDKLAEKIPAGKKITDDEAVTMVVAVLTSLMSCVATTT